MNVLVLHGPNLAWKLGAGKTVEDLDKRIRSHADALGAEVRIVHSNHEGILVDALHSEGAWADAVVVNAGAFARAGFALAEAVQLLGKPAVEVQLKSGPSVLQRVVLKELSRGPDGYFEALDMLAARLGKGARKPTKGLGRQAKPEVKAVPPPELKVVAKTMGRVPAPAPAPTKTIGRRPATETARAARTLGKAGDARLLATQHGAVSRGVVRQQIADRLAGRLSPAALSTWARTQWQDLQAGKACEAGQRELLEDVLQTLLLSTASKTSEDQLVSLMTQLGNR
jgi:3-dehydroquinate dehydratase II